MFFFFSFRKIQSLRLCILVIFEYLVWKRHKLVKERHEKSQTSERKWETCKKRDKNVNLDDNKSQTSGKSHKLVTKIDKQ